MAADNKERGEYVTEERIDKIRDFLEEGEFVHFLTRGSTIEEKVPGSNDSSTGTKGWVRAAITDRRVVVKIPKLTGSDKRMIPYEELIGVEVTFNLMKKVLSLQTPNKSYHIKADEPGKSEFRDIEDFIKRKIRQQSNPEEQAQSTTDSPRTIDPHGETRSAGITTGLCKECGSQVSKNANRCPECGWSPNEHKKWVAIHAVLALLFSFTLIGIPVGLYAGWKAGSHYKAAKKSLTD